MQLWKGIAYVAVTASFLLGYLYPRMVALLDSREKVLRSELEMIERLGRAAEWRDEDTAEHVTRVSRMSEVIALEAGLSPDRARVIALASQMHDIGKVAVPDTILLKPGPLTEEEFEVVKRHTTVGADILSGGTTEVLQTAERIARYHHERWDGSGYPEGLAGEQIPLEARIVAIADVFDALTSHRPYKKPWPIVKAIAAIQLSAGTHFDPHLVECFVRRLPEIAAIVTRHTDAPKLPSAPEQDQPSEDAA
jgi:putative two-component system response regulator